MKSYKNRAKRTDVNVKIKLRDIQGNLHPGFSSDEIEVSLINISKTGLAFSSKEKLVFNGFYDTAIVFPNKERFNAIVEIVRVEENENQEISYGGTFVGINSADQFKIDVFQILYDADRV